MVISHESNIHVTVFIFSFQAHHFAQNFLYDIQIFLKYAEVLISNKLCQILFYVINVCFIVVYE